MDALRTEVTIKRSPSVVYDYLIDVANYPEFCDHFQHEFRLTREDSVGLGAGGRFKVRGRDRFAYADFVIVEAARPLKLTLRGRGGRFNRIRTVYTWTLTASPRGEATTVTLDVERDATAPFDRFRDTFGGRRRDRRDWSIALERLEAILERGERRGERATVSGGARKPATDAPLR